MTAAPPAFGHLFSPVAIGPMRLANRVMQPATTNNLDDHGRVGADQIAFYVERAKGGVGIVPRPIADALLDGRRAGRAV